MSIDAKSSGKSSVPSTLLLFYFITTGNGHYQNYTHGSTGIQFLSSFCLNTRVQAARLIGLRMN